MAGTCPCCPTHTEPPAVPLTPAAAPPLTPAERLWTATRDQAVKLRMEGSGPGSEAPLTIHQMLLETVQNFGDHAAMASKEDGRWVTVSWRQYYSQSRAAAKRFLKVCMVPTQLQFYRSVCSTFSQVALHLILPHCHTLSFIDVNVMHATGLLT